MEENNGANGGYCTDATAQGLAEEDVAKEQEWV